MFIIDNLIPILINKYLSISNQAIRTDPFYDFYDQLSVNENMVQFKCKKAKSKIKI